MMFIKCWVLKVLDDGWMKILEDLVRRSRVDGHHTKLITGVMTRHGYVTAMTRNGASKFYRFCLSFIV